MLKITRRAKNPNIRYVLVGDQSLTKNNVNHDVKEF